MSRQETLNQIAADMHVWGNPAGAPAWKQHEWLIKARKACRQYIKELAVKRSNRLINKAFTA